MKIKFIPAAAIFLVFGLESFQRQSTRKPLQEPERPKRRLRRTPGPTEFGSTRKDAREGAIYIRATNGENQV